MKKAIVTGAHGFIGRNLVRELTENGFYVYAVVHKYEEARLVFKENDRVSLLLYDMENYANLINEKNLANADILFHFAWAGVSDDLSQNIEVQLKNIKASCDLVDIAVALCVKRYVFAGSIMEFEHNKAIEGEYYCVSRRNIYHVAKNAARKLTQILSNNSSITYVPVTISNVYGPGDKSMRLINQLLVNVLGKKRTALTSCEQKYDFIYVDDAAKAIRLVGERGVHNKNYYIGNKTPRILKEFIWELHDTIDSAVPLGIGDKEYQGIPLDYNEFDMLGIYEDFDFVAETGFSQGIKNTAEWIKSHLLD